MCANPGPNDIVAWSRRPLTVRDGDGFGDWRWDRDYGDGDGDGTEKMAKGWPMDEGVVTPTFSLNSSNGSSSSSS